MNNKPIGTAKSGYASAKHGPFACHNCIHFGWPHLCNHPDVIADARASDAEGLKIQKNSRAIVEPGGCCTYFREIE